MAKRPPWKKANPRKKAGMKSKKLSPAKKAKAKRAAKKESEKLIICFHCTKLGAEGLFYEA